MNKKNIKLRNGVRNKMRKEEKLQIILKMKQWELYEVGKYETFNHFFDVIGYSICFNYP